MRTTVVVGLLVDAASDAWCGDEDSLAIAAIAVNFDDL